MGIWTRLSFLFNVSLFLNWFYIRLILRIVNYGTASTDSAAYILGGYYYLNGKQRTSTIAQFQNNQWSKIGDLMEVRSGSSAILNNEEYLIIGGDLNFANGRSVNWLVSLQKCSSFCHYFRGNFEFLVLQPRFGILKQKRLEHTIPLNMVNILIRFCFLSIRIFAFDYNEIKKKHFLKIFYCKAGKAKNSAEKFSWTDSVSRIEVISWFEKF